MPYDVVIRGGMVVRPSGVEPLQIAIADEKIVELAPEIVGNATDEIDATGLHIFPGVIDPHVHFNEPGREEWEGLTTGPAALAAGGGTLFFDMPLNSSPPVLDGATFDAKVERAKAKSITDFALWGGLTPKNLDRMEELAERGVIGFKAFMCGSGIDEFPHVTEEDLHAGMTVAAQLGLPVAVHAENPLALEQAAANVRGRSWADYLASRPVMAEAVATRIAIEIARETGCALHVVHVSSPYVAGEIDAARTQGVNVTYETCPHYFMLCDRDLLEIGARAKCAPPLRSREDRDAMLTGLTTGAIDFVGSDHSPAPLSMKTGDDAFAIWGGIAGVQSTLPALVTSWVERVAALHKLPALIVENAAKRFRIAAKGKIEAGYDADLAMVDVNDRYTLTQEMLLDRHKLSPYVGREFYGRIRRTILRGQTIFRDGRIASEPIGRLVTPS
jgi:allantoinase